MKRFWTILPRRFLASVLATFVVVSALGADDWLRLRDIPREERVTLDKNLQAFDKLDSGSQRSIRALHEAIDNLPEPDRTDKYGLMRRYHLWVQTLTPSQKTELDSAPSNSKIKIVKKIKTEQAATNLPRPVFFHLVDLGGASPSEVATTISVWLAIPLAEKEKVAKLPEIQRNRRMNELAKSLKVAPIPEPKISDDERKSILERVAKKSPVFDGLLKRGDDEKKKTMRIRQIINSYYFLDNRDRADKVHADSLLQFDAALPPWLRSTFDTLPPDEAHRRLSILYRLIFPTPLEMGMTPKKAAGTGKAKSNVSKPSEKPLGDATTPTPPKKPTGPG